MNVRRLDKKDAPLMLEWMHDSNVIKYLQTDFSSKTILDCEKFIDNCIDNKNNLHLAIEDESDTYQGTVSLKHIQDGSAEFAIVVRSSAMGKGYSKYAMQRIFEIGLEKMNLTSIYWCVNSCNYRAIRFYDKNGYQRISPKSLKMLEGGTAKNRFKDTVGILSKKKTGERESTTEYEYSFPSQNSIGRRKGI